MTFAFFSSSPIFLCHFLRIAFLIFVSEFLLKILFFLLHNFHAFGGRYELCVWDFMLVWPWCEFLMRFLAFWEPNFWWCDERTVERWVLKDMRRIECTHWFIARCVDVARVLCVQVGWLMTGDESQFCGACWCECECECVMKQNGLCWSCLVRVISMHALHQVDTYVWGWRNMTWTCPCDSRRFTWEFGLVEWCFFLAVTVFLSGFFRLLFLRVDCECNQPSFFATVFHVASTFNGNLSKWDVANVNSMPHSKLIRIVENDLTCRELMLLCDWRVQSGVWLVVMMWCKDGK